MRLKSIKLAGFKSFVDPTTAHFPSNLSAVVGPNGCGKSNIIDAVRWVMGESSARNLRGESMADVIFNGSSGRKPVAQASIELIFDNSDGSLLGEYAAYTEIGVRRLVTRDGRSDYFLNGSRCRRKDITDLFLGTGLGPRSYAIIEQGMISRLIEAKPEELRVYIEEAAGISRYKDRRRDTELRMRHTRDNLDRLNDLREEMGRQLQHLERQAQSAEKYREYKDEELRLRALLQALRWRQQEGLAAQESRSLAQEELACTALQSERQGIETQIEAQRLQRLDLDSAVQQAQQEHYRLGHELASVQQSLQHRRERLLQIERDLRESEARHRQLQEHARTDAEEMREVQAQLEELAPEVQSLQQRWQQEQLQLQEAEATMSRWQQAWESFQESATHNKQSAELQELRLQQIEQSQKRARERAVRLQEEQRQLEDADDEVWTLLQEQVAELELRQEDAQERVRSLGLQLQQSRAQIQASEAELDDLRAQQQALQGSLTALQSLQDDALGAGQASQNWLQAQGLALASRLIDVLQVQPGWQRAVETVLGRRLHAVQVDELSTASAWPAPPAAMALLQTTLTDRQQHSADALAHEVQPAGVRAWLWGLRKVASLAEALARREELADGQAWVTPEGQIVGMHGLQWPAQQDGDGLLERQQRLHELRAQLQALQQDKDRCEEKLADLRAQRARIEEERDEAGVQVTALTQDKGLRLADLRARQVRREQLQARRLRIGDELQEVQRQQESDIQAYDGARELKEQALQAMQSDADRRQALLQERDQVRAAVDTVRDRARLSREQSHQLDMRQQSLQTRAQALERAQERAQDQLHDLSLRCDQLREEELVARDSPLQDEARLHELASAQEVAQRHWLALREQLAAIDEAMRLTEQQKQLCERSLLQRQEQASRLALKVQEAQIRMQSLQEQMQEQGWELQAWLAELSETLEETEIQAQIERIGVRIARLGPINLAAIDEYKQQLERKTYLDTQDADLREALEMLENAIRKIDRETRTLFKDTFDRVNQGFGDLFPKVFGGGHAYLELTGEDLLEAGVAIMARPPGKRNSTIHLLSGGEKALTALSLVFSIFALNPAPFCMLDEVDAPLDDANVGRFARLVEDMSQRLQFIYITHNKIAMEMAHQLMGVAMHEPGVSRLVAVNVEEAARMAAQ